MAHDSAYQSMVASYDFEDVPLPQWALDNLEDIDKLADKIFTDAEAFGDLGEADIPEYQITERTQKLLALITAKAKELESKTSFRGVLSAIFRPKREELWLRQILADLEGVDSEFERISALQLKEVRQLGALSSLHFKLGAHIHRLYPSERGEVLASVLLTGAQCFLARTRLSEARFQQFSNIEALFKSIHTQILELAAHYKLTP